MSARPGSASAFPEAGERCLACAAIPWAWGEQRPLCPTHRAPPITVSTTEMCTKCRPVGKPCFGECIPCLKWRIETLEAQVASLQMAAPRGIPRE